jgi:hypothetical protein
MKTPSFYLLVPAVLICGAAAQAPQAAPVFEPATRFHAPDLFPAGKLQGPSYRVRDQVVTDGFMAHFEIDSDFGLFEATGVPQAKRRIVEIEAIRKLVETSKSDLFAEGLKRSIEQPVDAVKNIAQDPVGSVKQVPKTVGHFFSKVGSSIGRGVEKVKRDNEEGKAPSAGEVGNTAKNVAGFDKAKLDTAKQLGVDPYSDNPRLQEEMDKVTWAFFAGGLPLRIGAAVASAGVTLTATNMVGIPEDMYALTQSELALRDERSLEVMGVTADDIRKFQLNTALSTTRRHRIVTCLAGMPKTAGRGLVIRVANSCEDADQADFLVEAISILAERQRSGATDYTSIKVLGRLPGAMTAAGNLEVPAPVDYVTWTEQVAAFATRDDLGKAPKFLIHTGRLSPAAGKGFSAAGWTPVAIGYPSK